MSSLVHNSEREDRASEALIAAALHQEKTPVDAATVARFMRGATKLTPAEEQALARAPLCFTAQTSTQTEGIPASADAEMIAALHREKPDKGFSKETEDELDRKRRELREKLRRQREERKK